MIKITNIKINNFYSIGYSELDFENGVYLVYGENLDAEVVSDKDVSNGAGKTTLFNAVFQGLYNKNLKDVSGKIDSASNIYTKKPYSISVSLEKDGTSYDIVNDRNLNYISIFKEGEELGIKGVKNQLNYIKNLIGMDFASFSSLVFLNSTSLENIIDISSKDNIVYQFFNIERIKELEKNIKEYVKTLKAERTAISIKKDTLLSNISVVDNIEKTDTSKLENIASELRDALLSLESSPLAKKIENLSKLIDEETKLLSSLNSKKVSKKSELSTITNLMTKLESGVCPLCGSESVGKLSSMLGEITNLESELSSIDSEYQKQNIKCSSLTTELTNANNELNTKKKELSSELNNIKAKIESIKMTEKRLSTVKESVESAQEEIKVISRRVLDIDDELLYFSSILGIIKNGSIVNEYLKKYSKLLQVNINELNKFSSFNINILVGLEKGKLSYKFFDTDKFKTFTQLSSGERTRVALIILLSTLKAIEQLSGVSINILVLDELLSALDKDGVDFLKSIINILRKDKAIFIITHHNEIEQSFADRFVYVTKEKNITSVEVTDGE